MTPIWAGLVTTSHCQAMVRASTQRSDTSLSHNTLISKGETLTPLTHTCFFFALEVLVGSCTAPAALSLSPYLSATAPVRVAIHRGRLRSGICIEGHTGGKGHCTRHTSALSYCIPILSQTLETVTVATRPSAVYFLLRTYAVTRGKAPEREFSMGLTGG